MRARNGWLRNTGWWPCPAAVVGLVLASGASTVLAGPTLAASDQWPQWRGPSLDGRSATAHDLPTEWSLEKNVVWRTPLPCWSGATPVLWGDRLFVCSPSPAPEKAEAAPAEAPERGRGDRGGRGPGGFGRGGGRDPGGQELHLLCISAADGSILWQRQIDAGNALHMKGNDSSPSPVVDAEHVWVVTGNGVVQALSHDGDVLWERRLQDDYGAFGLNWGYASSPLLTEDHLVIPVLHGFRTDDPSYVLALDPFSGDTLWKVERPTDAPRESPDAYTTPFLLHAGDEEQVVVSGGDYVTSHSLETGEELWRVGGLNPQKAPNYRIVGSPLASGNLVIAPTRNRPLLAIRVGEDGRANDDSVAWRYDDRGGPDVPTPVCDGERLYLVNDSGMVTCLDVQTGAVLWGPERTAEGTVSSSLLLADGKLYFTNEDATTVVLRAGPSFELLATNELDGSYTLSTPIAVGDRLYLRTGTHLYCIATARS